MSATRLATTAATALLIAALGACSTSTPTAHTPAAPAGGGNHARGTVAGATAPSRDTVTGLRDAVRHVPAVTTAATRPHLVRRCTTATRQVTHTRRTGSAGRRSVRTWHTTERYQRCRKVRRGTETYRRTTRPEHWCVRLDAVGGHRTRNDLWYQVTRTTYDDALHARDHARLEFTPRHTGC
ncbi:hypothetical protein [Streptomyces sp. NPDC005004]